MPLDRDPSTMLAKREPGYSLSREFYCDPQVFALDMEHIWYREWLFAIPACEIPRTGDFVTHTIGAYPIILARGGDGQVRAFHNSCRHRGSIICKTHKGRAPKLVCPYHQWTYNLDGTLFRARDMGPDFDPSGLGLKQVHCRTVAGLVYICLADVAPDFQQFADAATRYLAPHDLVNSKIAFETTCIERGNWKLVWENNRECYHCLVHHPSLNRTFPEDARAIGSTVDGSMSPELDRHVARCEEIGAPSAYQCAQGGEWRFVRAPLLGDGESYTLDTRAAVAIPNSSFPFKDAGALLKFLYPATWNHFLGDHSIVFRLTPIGPTETELCTKWLVHKDAVEGRDYDLERLTEVWRATNDEDSQVVEDNQRGILSPAYEPGPYSPIHEGGTMQFVDWYASTLARRVVREGAPAGEASPSPRNDLASAA